MSINTVLLSAYVDSMNYKDRGNFVSVSMKLTLAPLTVLVPRRDPQNTVMPMQLGDQVFWASVAPPKRKDHGGESAPDIERIQRTIEAIEHGSRSILVFDGEYNTWGENESKRELKFGFPGFRLGRTQIPAFNHCVIQGKVTVQNAQDPRWIMIEHRYLNSFEKDKSKAWKSKSIPVWSPFGFPPCNGQEMLVIGQLSVKAIVEPQLGVYQVSKDPYLHIIATEFRACPV